MIGTIWIPFSFEIVLAPHGAGFFSYLVKKKKRASATVCQMFVFLSVHFYSVSLAAANKQIDRSWTFSVQSLHKAEAKSDVIYSSKDSKGGNWFNNAISNTSNDCNPMKLQWNPNPKDQCSYSALETLNLVLCILYHFYFGKKKKKLGTGWFFSGYI